MVKKNFALIFMGILLLMSPNINAYSQVFKEMDVVASIMDVDSFIAVLKEDDDSNARRIAAMALGQLGDPRAVEPLIFLAKEDSNKFVRINTMLALIEFKDSRALHIYSEALDFFSDLWVSDHRGSYLQARIKAAQTILDLEESGSDKLHIRAREILEHPLTVASTFIEATTHYDAFGRPSWSELDNCSGKSVAVRKYTYHSHNKTLLSQEILMYRLAGDTLFIITHDNYGRPENPKRFCLDAQGNIIKEAGKPVLVSPSEAEQKTESDVVYKGLGSRQILFINKKIYPCKNCAQVTGIENCKFVW